MSDALFRGWLLAWIVWSAVPFGALVLVMIYAVTGGRWGETLAPALRPATALVPLAALTFFGVALGLHAAFPWAAGTGAAPDVLRLYLDPVLFLVRAAVTLLGWSVLAGLFLSGRAGTLVAGLGLTFYGLTISLVSIDWILSVEPGFNSSAFAADVAFHQILAALAFAALVSPPSLDARGASDLAGLMLATLLGVLYLELMSYIVAWYGDLPPKAEWYLKRGASPWGGVLVATLFLGGIVPFLALLFSAVRKSPALLRGVGLLLLIGVTVHFAWLVLPAYGEGAAAAAAVAVLALFALVLVSGSVFRLIVRRVARPRHV